MAAEQSALGIIPAYAGSTVAGQGHDVTGADHPRIRGEHHVPTEQPGANPGSSPHTRGARPACPRQRRRGGIIPAYAGSTGRRGESRRGVGDHPRIRGEHRAVLADRGRDDGSSPHTRGAPRKGWVPSVQPGIIPAYAGSTRLIPCSRATSSDHPRIRGEHLHAVARVAVLGGSSPHTRGARLGAPRTPLRGRIIPAYAGSTSPSNSPRERSGDHPRIRGEHERVSIRETLSPGSSPHTRGALSATPTNSQN